VQGELWREKGDVLHRSASAFPRQEIQPGASRLGKLSKAPVGKSPFAKEENIMPGPIPKANAIVICDYAMQEAGTGKWSLIGIFSQIHSAQFPVIHRQLCVYLNFTDAQGHYHFRLELIDLDQEEEPAMMKI